MSFFIPTAGQLRLSLTTTPTTPVQLVQSGGNSFTEQYQCFRVMIFGGSTGSDIHFCFAPTQAQCAAIATGAEPTAGVQTTGVITFAAPVSTSAAYFLDYFALPTMSQLWVSAYCAVNSATADFYLLPMKEVAH